MRRKSDALKQRQGTYRPDRCKQNSVPMLLEDVPEPPSGFSPEAVIIWNETAKKLVSLRMLSSLDLPVLELFSKTFILWRSVSHFLEINGVSFVTESGLHKSRPEATTLKELLSALDGLTAKLGLSVRDREKITLPEPCEPDPFEEFLRTGRANNERGGK